MDDRIKTTEDQAHKELDSVQNADELSQLKIKYLGRKGIVSGLFKELQNITQQQEKAEFGKDLNRVKAALEEDFKNRLAELSQASLSKSDISVDITMPPERPPVGTLHPLTKTISDIISIFSHLGFAIIEGPEIETEYNNFEALNIPLTHPSRESFDTFYINPVRNIRFESNEISTGVKDKWLLRSHTSPVQIRYMQDHKPPFSIAVPGKVFRPDATDASHSFMFHQIEGLMVSDNISFSNLKWLLFEFARQYFGPSSKVRFRPHFFPFTEPSAEVDVSCMICNGTGCRVCSNKGWLEILGAGMVDPNVFDAVGIDHKKYSGLAFGMGVERIAMLKYGIDDIRLFFENDVRFLRQF